MEDRSKQPDFQELIKNALNDYFGITGNNKRFFDATQIPRICDDISEINTNFKNMSDKLENKYVTKEEFMLVKNIVLGGSGFILIAVLGALVYLVIIK